MMMPVAGRPAQSGRPRRRPQPFPGRLARAPSLKEPVLNSLLADLGLASWKPVLTALLLPPVPFLLLIVIGARLMLPRRGWGWLLVMLGVSGIWLSSCSGAVNWFDELVLKPPREIGVDRTAALKADARRSPALAIVVLGGGLEPYAPEYGTSNLSDASLERLRYGLWLGRETGIPVAFSGGQGWGAAEGGASEAETAARIASRDFNRPLRWTEAQSRDTRENAARTVGLLSRAGITHIVLVTHGWHMPRAQRAFEQAAAANAPGLRIEAAPMGLARRVERPELDWLPTARGHERMRQSLREALGLVLGG